MSKTIDVREGDKFTICPDGTVFQYRDGKCRSVNAHRVSNWWPDNLINDEYEITERAAKKFLDWWGYTLTPAAKPEANPADVPATVKPELTVPLVDAVWVEVLGECVYAYTSIEAATKVWQRYLDKGEARIVRIDALERNKP